MTRLAKDVSLLGFSVASVGFFVMLIRHIIEFAAGSGNVDGNGVPTWGNSDFVAILHFFIIGVTILVVAIPEGLP